MRPACNRRYKLGKILVRGIASALFGRRLILAGSSNLLPRKHQQPYSAGCPTMDDPIAKAQAAVTKQGDTVRSLKAELKEGKVEKVSAQ